MVDNKKKIEKARQALYYDKSTKTNQTQKARKQS